MKYNVFTDLENTLSKSREKLSEEKLALIEKLEHKMNFCISTASPYSEVKHFLEINNLNWNYICEAGAYAYFNGLIYQKQFRIPPKQLIPFINDIVFLFYQIDGYTYIYNYMPFLEGIYPKYSEKVILNNLSDMKHNLFNQMYVCIKQAVRYQFVEIMEKHKIDSSLLMEDSKNVFFRLRAKDVNKGYFIPVILKDNNIDFESTIGIGDSIEDIALVKKTYKKVAVQNAEPLLLCETDTITESVDNDGVFNYLTNL